jgi:hypothetical protein
MTDTIVRASTRGAGYGKLMLALNHRRTFRTSGALSGQAYVPDAARYASVGQLRGDELAKFRAERAGATFIVFSYSTPIAWEVDGKVYVVSQRFSMTTSHHQGKLWALTQPEGYFDGIYSD